MFFFGPKYKEMWRQLLVLNEIKLLNSRQRKRSKKTKKINTLTYLTNERWSLFFLLNFKHASFYNNYKLIKTLLSKHVLTLIP